MVGPGPTTAARGPRRALWQDRRAGNGRRRTNPPGASAIGIKGQELIGRSLAAALSPGVRVIGSGVFRLRSLIAVSLLSLAPLSLTSCGDSGGNGSESDSSDSATTSQEPVMCGDVECEAGQACVQLGDRCDPDMMPPDFVTPPPTCETIPAECDGMEGNELRNCLESQLCTNSDSVCASGAEYSNNLLMCNDPDCDCF